MNFLNGCYLLLGCRCYDNNRNRTLNEPRNRRATQVPEVQQMVYLPAQEGISPTINDIWANIFSFLSPVRSVALSLTCKQFQKFSHPRIKEGKKILILKQIRIINKSLEYDEWFIKDSQRLAKECIAKPWPVPEYEKWVISREKFHPREDKKKRWSKFKKERKEIQYHNSQLYAINEDHNERIAKRIEKIRPLTTARDALTIKLNNL